MRRRCASSTGEASGVACRIGGDCRLSRQSDCRRAGGHALHGAGRNGAVRHTVSIARCRAHRILEAVRYPGFRRDHRRRWQAECRRYRPDVAGAGADDASVGHRADLSPRRDNACRAGTSIDRNGHRSRSPPSAGEFRAVASLDRQCPGTLCRRTGGDRQPTRPVGQPRCNGHAVQPDELHGEEGPGPAGEDGQGCAGRRSLGAGVFSRRQHRQ